MHGREKRRGEEKIVQCNLLRKIRERIVKKERFIEINA